MACGDVADPIRFAAAPGKSQISRRSWVDFPSRSRARVQPPEACASMLRCGTLRTSPAACGTCVARWPLPTQAMHSGLGGLDSNSSAVYNVCMTARAMQEATFLILTALAAGSQHGYGIITDVKEISGGRVRLRAGTLYTALDRLRADQLIGVDREEIVDNRLRRYYRLTPKGSELLAAEAARLQANAAAALSRLDLAGGTT